MEYHTTESGLEVQVKRTISIGQKLHIMPSEGRIYEQSVVEVLFIGTMQEVQDSNLDYETKQCAREDYEVLLDNLDPDDYVEDAKTAEYMKTEPWVVSKCLVGSYEEDIIALPLSEFVNITIQL